MLKKILKILGIVLAVLIVALGILYYYFSDRFYLTVAVYTQDKDAVIYYVKEKKVDPNNAFPKVNLIGYYITLHNKSIDYEFLELLISLGCSLNQANKEPLTPLLHAIIWNDQKLINFLIDNGADVNFLLNEKYKPLGFALQMKDCENSKLLIDRRATLEADSLAEKHKLTLDFCKNNNWISQHNINKQVQEIYE